MKITAVKIMDILMDREGVKFSRGLVSRWIREEMGCLKLGTSRSNLVFVEKEVFEGWYARKFKKDSPEVPKTAVEAPKRP